MIALGFTGTREGMTAAQKEAFRLLIESICPDEFHHGCCVGADDEATDIVEEVMGAATVRIVGWPSTLVSLTSTAAKLRSSDIHEAEPPLDRNRKIVGSTGQMIACPKGPEERRSGTWATVRYARKLGRPVTVIRPNGEVYPM